MLPQIKERGGKSSPEYFDCANSGRAVSLSTIFKGEVCQKPFRLLRNELSFKWTKRGGGTGPGNWSSVTETDLRNSKHFVPGAALAVLLFHLLFSSRLGGRGGRRKHFKFRLHRFEPQHKTEGHGKSGFLSLNPTEVSASASPPCLCWSRSLCLCADEQHTSQQIRCTRQAPHATKSSRNTSWVPGKSSPGLCEEIMQWKECLLEAGSLTVGFLIPNTRFCSGINNACQLPASWKLVKVG